MPDAEPPPSALAVGAHPDDCEVACGATLAKWARAGSRVDLAVVTDGSRGSHDAGLDDAALRATREAEQRAAAARLGAAGVTFLGQVDGEARVSEELVGALVVLIRTLRPAVLLTHDPWRRYELHPDHLVTGEAVRLAVFRAREPRVRPEVPVPAPRAPQELWLFNAQDPDHAEEAREHLAVKAAALLEHRSQLATSFGVASDDPAAVARLEALVRAQGDAERFRRLRLGA